jgi:hypothetical protein
MLATLTDAPFDDPAWVFENEWDGFRIELRGTELRRVNCYLLPLIWFRISGLLFRVHLVAPDGQPITFANLKAGLIRGTLNVDVPPISRNRAAAETFNSEQVD